MIKLVIKKASDLRSEIWDPRFFERGLMKVLTQDHAGQLSLAGCSNPIAGIYGSFYTHSWKFRPLHSHVIACHGKCFQIVYCSLPSPPLYGKYVAVRFHWLAVWQCGWTPLSGLSSLRFAHGCSWWMHRPERHLPWHSSLLMSLRGCRVRLAFLQQWNANSSFCQYFVHRTKLLP